MNTLTQVMGELKKKGSASRRKIYSNHNSAHDMYGVSVVDLKTIAKKIKGRQDLATELFATGNFDAMYLAGIVADGAQMTKKELESWAKEALAPMICEYAVPGVVSESPHARMLALKWIRSRKENVASAGWCTYAAIVSVTEDEELDLAEIRDLLSQVVETIDEASNRIRYCMNGFVIAVGSYVKPLLKDAKRAAKALGKVEVDMGGTACKVPLATEYIGKVEKAGRVGRKRKTAKC